MGFLSYIFLIILLLVFYGNIKNLLHILKHICLQILNKIKLVLLNNAKSPAVNEIVLVTGGADGIGREIAYEYGKLGARVVLADINTEALKRTVEDFERESISTYSYECDVSSWEQVKNLQLRIQNEVGPISILVNNAGTADMFRKIEDYSEEAILKMVSTNLLSVFWTIKAFLPSMKKLDKGSIVTICSVTSYAPLCYTLPDCATKAGVAALMRGVREEVGRENKNIKFLSVYPDFTTTSMTKKIRYQMFNPEEIAEATLRAERRGETEISIPCCYRAVSAILNLIPGYTGNNIHYFIQQLRFLYLKGDYVALKKEEK